MKSIVLLSVVIIALSACASAPPPISPKEQVGIASDYPNDREIKSDNRVVFYENFEDKSLGEIIDRWGDAKHIQNLSLSNEITQLSKGSHSLRIKDNGHLYTHFSEIDTLFARFYVKFHIDTGYIHHLVNFVADKNPTPWPKGGAGRRPRGDQFFSVAIEPDGLSGRSDPPGIWTFYNYWHEMLGGWGNKFYTSDDPIEPGKWYCIEVMIKTNSSPTLDDGELALWVDGALKGHFRNFLWRTSNELKLNTISLSYYVTERAMRRNRDFRRDERVMEIWFDDIVIATSYIGPISEGH